MMLATRNDTSLKSETSKQPQQQEKVAKLKSRYQQLNESIAEWPMIAKKKSIGNNSGTQAESINNSSRSSSGYNSNTQNSSSHLLYSHRQRQQPRHLGGRELVPMAPTLASQVSQQIESSLRGLDYNKHGHEQPSYGYPSYSSGDIASSRRQLAPIVRRGSGAALATVAAAAKQSQMLPMMIDDELYFDGVDLIDDTSACDEDNSNISDLHARHHSHTNGDGNTLNSYHQHSQYHNQSHHYQFEGRSQAEGASCVESIESTPGDDDDDDYDEDLYYPSQERHPQRQALQQQQQQQHQRLFDAELGANFSQVRPPRHRPSADQVSQSSRRNHHHHHHHYDQRHNLLYQQAMAPLDSYHSNSASDGRRPLPTRGGYTYSDVGNNHTSAADRGASSETASNNSKYLSQHHRQIRGEFTCAPSQSLQSHYNHNLSTGSSNLREFGPVLHQASQVSSANPAKFAVEVNHHQQQHLPTEQRLADASQLGGSGNESRDSGGGSKQLAKANGSGGTSKQGKMQASRLNKPDEYQHKNTASRQRQHQSTTTRKHLQQQSGGGGKQPADDERPALGICGKFAKLLLFITNIIFWSTGIALCAWGVLSLVDDHKYNLSQLLVFEPSTKMSLFQLLSWSFITLGCATVLVGFCGCSAMLKNNRWILGLYIFLILAIFALDLATGLLAIIFQERLVANVRLRLVNKLRSEYGVQASFTAAVDYIQTQHECCGLEGHFDYDQSLWRLQRLGGFEATVARTCCHLRNTFDDQAHINPRPVNESMCQSTDVRFHQSYRYRKGCLDDLERLVRQKIWTFTVGCGAVGLIICLCLLFATCFCRSIPSPGGSRETLAASQTGSRGGQSAKSKKQLSSNNLAVMAQQPANDIQRHYR